MNILIELAYLILFSVIGKVISHVLHIPIPGSVIGMLLLLLCLIIRVIKPKQIEQVSEFLIGNLALFFVPAGVGIMVSYRAMQGDILKILLILISTTIISIMISSLMIQKLIKKEEKIDETDNK